MVLSDDNNNKTSSYQSTDAGVVAPPDEGKSLLPDAIAGGFGLSSSTQAADRRNKIAVILAAVCMVVLGLASERGGIGGGGLATLVDVGNNEYGFLKNGGRFDGCFEVVYCDGIDIPMSVVDYLSCYNENDNPVVEIFGGGDYIDLSLDEALGRYAFGQKEDNDYCATEGTCKFVPNETKVRCKSDAGHYSFSIECKGTQYADYDDDERESGCFVCKE